jgi:hypothetical protein
VHRTIGLALAKVALGGVVAEAIAVKANIARPVAGDAVRRMEVTLGIMIEIAVEIGIVAKGAVAAVVVVRLAVIGLGGIAISGLRGIIAVVAAAGAAAERHDRGRYCKGAKRHHRSMPIPRLRLHINNAAGLCSRWNHHANVRGDLQHCCG